MKLNNTFAIGCLIQWYEIELIEEYLQSVKNAVDVVDNKENVIIDVCFNMAQNLEKIENYIDYDFYHIVKKQVHPIQVLLFVLSKHYIKIC